jgi:hypothetical protein
LKDLIGTKFSRHGAQGNATFKFDPDAQKDPELKVMVEGLKNDEVIFEEWYSFDGSVRGKPGYTVVATVTGASNIVYPTNDGSGETPSIWAKYPGKGRMLYTSVGHRADIYTQKSAWAKAVLWQNMRFAAGDFEHGCTNPASPGFVESARVDNNSCPTSIDLKGNVQNFVPQMNLTFPSRGQEFKMDLPVNGSADLKIHDVSGKLVWSQNVVAAEKTEIQGVNKAGIYFVTAKAGNKTANMRIRLD